jgi:hypothetical protein
LRNFLTELSCKLQHEIVLFYIARTMGCTWLLVSTAATAVLLAACALPLC